MIQDIFSAFRWGRVLLDAAARSFVAHARATVLPDPLGALADVGAEAERLRAEVASLRVELATAAVAHAQAEADSHAWHEAELRHARDDADAARDQGAAIHAKLDALGVARMGGDVKLRVDELAHEVRRLRSVFAPDASVRVVSVVRHDDGDEAPPIGQEQTKEQDELKREAAASIAWRSAWRSEAALRKEAENELREVRRAQETAAKERAALLRELDEAKKARDETERKLAPLRYSEDAARHREEAAHRELAVARHAADAARRDAAGARHAADVEQAAADQLRRQVAAALSVLAAAGCDCECADTCGSEHGDECERCLGCRVEAALRSRGGAR